MEPEFDEDSCSDLSSSSSSCSSSEEESVGEEEDEDSEEDAPSSGPKGAERGDKERRKRRRAVAGRRRQLRSKYESVEDFNPEAEVGADGGDRENTTPGASEKLTSGRFFDRRAPPRQRWTEMVSRLRWGEVQSSST